MIFNDELQFEAALIKVLFEKGWERNVLKNKTEQELLQNWANILFDNNRGRDRLNDCPLTDGEMQQIIEQIKTLRTPLKLNGFINGKTVSIKRDNPDDTLHFGKIVALTIYDRQEIAAGRSRYQIVEQPIFPAKNAMLNSRRGDLMLLINGMPLIHIELKKSGVDVSQACYQIEKYSHEGIFTGLFSLVQIFVAMTPSETLYFANPGIDGKFNKDYYFHWANFNNDPINDWKDIASSFLSIPMAHQLIGFYTVADDTDGVLKVMRSYQYYAARAISEKVAKTKWADKNQYGGYIWHTTGSGKTMTSFKSAQLIAGSKDADKVVFLVDRIELGTQSLLEYRNFAEATETVQATENTNVLITKLKSPSPQDTLIVTSIQKLSNIRAEGSVNDRDLELINEKRIVFIVDECHRSTFGDMLSVIKLTFPNAIFFGFTGTPIFEENKKNKMTMAGIFGDELHRYSIADGIRDKNVLGFDPYMVLTYKEKDLRHEVALQQAKAKSLDEVMADDRKKEIYFEYMKKVPMAGYYDQSGVYRMGIEDYLGTAQYDRDEHHNAVVKDILDGWQILSAGRKFHAIFATSSIPEAIQYYRLFKAQNSGLRIAALFDQNIDNTEKAVIKEEAVVEMLTDYNATFGTDFTIPTYAKYKKDVALRLAHKKPYLGIDKRPEKQVDLLIVVDQMLTGFDSKWVNVLYLDKLLRYENIIQAFSRTNRLFGHDKPFGTIRYYRKPFTMKRNIESAVKLYSGDKPLGLFADHLEYNLNAINTLYLAIESLFTGYGIANFSKLPTEGAGIAKFAMLFKEMNAYLNAAKLQGFHWKKLEYEFKQEDGLKTAVEMALDERIYNILLQRYKEIQRGSGSCEDVPFEIESYITEINTGTIDSDYMNERFEKYRKLLQDPSTPQEVIEQTLNELHKTFASLSQEEQKYAAIFLGDVERGDVVFEEGKTLKDYITDYQTRAKDDQIHRFAVAIGVDEEKLRYIMGLHVTDANINEFGRFDALIQTVDKSIAKKYFEQLEGKIIPMPRVAIKVDALLRKFILYDGFEV